LTVPADIDPEITSGKLEQIGGLWVIEWGEMF